ncbi:hypothetical protein FNV43_RR10311 [Rhamnella rubrinervis]|uniref:Uncharacterized protein n=1 Tax=Rhamnella rubrinervis TaxID=2594499 RepID=A0A8K0HBL2_9ROSA|nr:hypothetical protein FNV43_RR10311 [Rhamnella rubrinervis]
MVPIKEPFEESMVEPRFKRVRFNNDLPSSSGIGYRDIDIVEDSVHREAIQLATQGIKIPPVAAEEFKDLEESDDPKEDPEEDLEESENLVVAEDSLEPIDLEDEDSWNLLNSD